MQLEVVNTGNALDGPLREYIGERLATVLGSMKRKIGSVTVRVGEVPADGGAVKQYCAITVRLNRGRTVTSVDLGEELLATIDRVVDAATSAAEQQLKSHWW
jgi:hypothetical protein